VNKEDKKLNEFEEKGGSVKVHLHSRFCHVFVRQKTHPTCPRFGFFGGAIADAIVFGREY
jgi:hypothetical protein